MSKVLAVYQKHRALFFLAIFAVLCVLPFVVTKALFVRYACNILMYATLAGSLNAINGYSGQTGELGLDVVLQRCKARRWCRRRPAAASDGHGAVFILDVLRAVRAKQAAGEVGAVHGECLRRITGDLAAAHPVLGVRQGTSEIVFALADCL